MVFLEKFVEVVHELEKVKNYISLLEKDHREFHESVVDGKANIVELSKELTEIKAHDLQVVELTKFFTDKRHLSQEWDVAEGRANHLVSLNNALNEEV